jgi:DNA processing protein
MDKRIFSEASLRAHLILAHTTGVSSRKVLKLIHEENLSALEICEYAAHQNKQMRAVFSSDTVSELARPGEAVATHIQNALNWFDPDQHQYLITWDNPIYPPLLRHIPDPPLLLYVKGSLEYLNKPSLAIVGSRNPTAQGARNAFEFASSLSKAGFNIVSGLALGIDSAAHEGALSHELGTTVAVIGTGIDRVYPAKNRELAHGIVERGVIVSEYPVGTPPRDLHFPQRNRIIAGLSRGVLVVEAALKSGSLITGRLAADFGRDVFAIPGSIHSVQSKGCHTLIKQGAKLVDTVDDIVGDFCVKQNEIAVSEEQRSSQIEIGNNGSSLSTISRGIVDSTGVSLDGLEADAQRLLTYMAFDAYHADELQSLCEMDNATVLSQLLQLELAGVVARLIDGRWQRVAP